jgi:flagellar hook-associated protein 1 FlgK
MAQSIRLAATELGDASRGADVRLASTVTSINEIAARLAEYNVELRRGYRNDAGLDAKIHTELEELAGLVDTSVIVTSDGSLTVLAGGRVPLVIGDRAYPLELHFSQPADPPPVYPGGPVSAQILDAGGNDVTGCFSSGSLAGTLAFRNGVIPELLGDAYQPGQLNTFAKGLADRVNAILGAGLTDAGTPPLQNLFTYDSTNETAVARTFGVEPLMTTADLAPADPGPPYVVNGTALKLTALEKPLDAADMIDGSSFMSYYGRIAARVGRATAQARQDGQAAMELAAQARTMRDELCGISLDSEAIRITQFQRAYEACAKMISVLAELSEVAIGIIR